MFDVEKPRQFHYVPRFYDPEKEKWEALKKKYAIEQEKKSVEAAPMADAQADATGDELEYFQQRVRDIDQEDREKGSRLTWRDLFRKREMPKFNYQPRFSGTAAPVADRDSNADAEAQQIVDRYRQTGRQIKIRRRFDISDSDYMKPISGTKIVLYSFIAFILLLVVFAF